MKAIFTVASIHSLKTYSWSGGKPDQLYGVKVTGTYDLQLDKDTKVTISAEIPVLFPEGGQYGIGDEIMIELYSLEAMRHQPEPAFASPADVDLHDPDATSDRYDQPEHN